MENTKNSQIKKLSFEDEVNQVEVKIEKNFFQTFFQRFLFIIRKKYLREI